MAGGLAAATTAGLAVLLWSNGPTTRDVLFDEKEPEEARRDAFVAVLAAAFPELRFASGTIESFVEAVVEHSRLPRHERHVRRALWRFLLSTDLFVGETGRTREIRFVQYYDPYVNPCWNPLFRSS